MVGRGAARGRSRRAVSDVSEDAEAPPRTGYNHLPLPDVAPDTIDAILATHGIDSSEVRLQLWSGAMNTIYEVGDELMLRVPMAIPEATRCIVEEAEVLPVLADHGIAAPRLVAYDDSRTHLDVPYTIYRRLQGISMDWWEVEHALSADLYREVGRELAVLHTSVTHVPDESVLATPRTLDPDPVLAIPRLPLTARRWIESAFDRLRPLVDRSVETRFLHAEVRPGNAVVDDGRLVGLIDWGSAGWGDPAVEFHALWVPAVPHALAGYREVAPLVDDDGAEARILWDHLSRVLGLEGAIDVLRGIDWVMGSSEGTPDWIRDLLPGPPPPMVADG